MTDHTCEYSGITFPTKDEWISVKDRLPEDNKLVLLFEPSTYIKIGTRSSDCNYTHWMPLPEPPK